MSYFSILVIPARSVSVEGAGQKDGASLPCAYLSHVLTVTSPFESITGAFEMPAAAEVDQVDPDRAANGSNRPLNGQNRPFADTRDWAEESPPPGRLKRQTERLCGEPRCATTSEC